VTARSIRARLLLSLVPLFVLVEAMIGGSTYRHVLNESQALFDYHLEQMALSLRDQGEVPSPPVPPAERDNFDFVVQIWNADGSRVYISQTRSRVRLPDRATLGFADITVDDERWRVYGLLARNRVIQIGQPYAVRERIAVAAALRSLTPLLVAAPLVALAVWWLVGLALRPMVRVTRELRRRDATRLDPVSEEALPAEIEPMVRQLNGLLARLRQAFAARQAFIADAAHELRTPLAAVKLQAGLLERATSETDRTQALAALKTGVDRAAHLVSQLLTLARSEPDAVRPDAVQDDTDLAAITRSTLAGLRPIAAGHEIELALNAPDSLALPGNPDALGGLVRNLVDNAIRYAPADSEVTVTLSVDAPMPAHTAMPADAATARLVVDDAGPGIPPDERERVFDRFYRRAQGEQDGSGLGLAIVRAIVERHRGRVLLTDSPQGGLRVVVELPMTTPPPAAA